MYKENIPYGQSSAILPASSCPGPAAAPVLVSWEFLARVLKLGLSCVRPGGKYLTHVSGKVTRYLQLL